MTRGRRVRRMFEGAERHAVEVEREAAERLAEHVASLDLDRHEQQAAWFVFDAVGMPLVFPRESAKLSGSDLAELLTLAGLAPVASAVHHYAYRDRSDWVHVPGDALIDLARRIARVHVQAIIEKVEAIETSQLEALGRAGADREELLGEMIPIALVRQWVLDRDEPARLGRENARLRALVVAAARELELAGRPAAASLLRAVLD